MNDFSDTKDFGKLLLMIKHGRRNSYGCIVLNTQFGKEDFLQELSKNSPNRVVEVDFSNRVRHNKHKDSSLIAIGNHSKTMENFRQKYGEDCVLVFTNLTMTISNTEEDIKLLISEININRDNYLHSNMFVILVLPKWFSKRLLSEAYDFKSAISFFYDFTDLEGLVSSPNRSLKEIELPERSKYRFYREQFQDPTVSIIGRLMSAIEFITCYNCYYIDNEDELHFVILIQNYICNLGPEELRQNNIYLIKIIESINELLYNSHLDNYIYSTENYLKLVAGQTRLLKILKALKPEKVLEDTIPESLLYNNDYIKDKYELWKQVVGTEYLNAKEVQEFLDFVLYGDKFVSAFNLRMPLSEKSFVALSIIPAPIDLIGREKDVGEILSLLEQYEILSIHAMSGIGKTSVAVMAINQIKKDLLSGKSQYRHVAWINSTGNLINDLSTLHVPGIVAPITIEDKIQKVCNFLQNSPTFLVIDNMNTPPTHKEEDLLNHICGRTKVLITSIADIHVARNYNLALLDTDSSLVLFYRHFQHNKKITLNQIRDRMDYIYAKKLVEKIDYNTLLIELIANIAYEGHWKLDDLWKKLEKDVFGENSRHSIKGEHGDNRILLLLTQIQRLYEISDLSFKQKEIMSFISLFPAEHSVFFDVFKWAGFEADEHDDLGELQERGWIEKDEEGYLIHSLVKESITLQCNNVSFDESRYKSLINELSNIKQYIPENMADAKAKERLLVIDTVCRLLIKNGSKRINAAHLFNSIAEVYYTQENYEEALKYFDKALEIYEKILGTFHPTTAATYNKIASVLQDQGSYQKALEYYGKLLEIYTKMPGAEYLFTAAIYNSIARLLHDQGNYQEALESYFKALEIYEKTLGMEHPNTAMTYSNMARVLQDQGNYHKALECYSRVLEIYTKTLGREHPTVAAIYNNIARLLQDQGDYRKAQDGFSIALEIYEKTLGMEHPDTAMTYSNMARVLRDQGNYQKALECYSKALEINKKVLGMEHPNTATTYNNIAMVLHDQGNYQEALECYSKALDISEKVLGRENPSIATTYSNIAGVYYAQKKYKESLKWYSKALEINEKMLGMEHPNTAMTYSNMARVLQDQGNYQKALEYYSKALGINEKVLGREHPNTVTIYNNIARIYYVQGNYQEALEYYTRALDIKKMVLGTFHPSIADLFCNIALVYKAQGKYEDSLKYFDKALEIYEKVMGREHPNTAAICNNIAKVYSNQGKNEEAMKYYKRALGNKE